RNRIPLSILAVAALASPVAGQTTLAVGAAASEPYVGAAASAAAPGSAVAAGAGFSRAVRVVVTHPGDVLDPSQLFAFGDGWQHGHRWIGVEEPEEDEDDGLLGVPIVPPAEYTSHVPLASTAEGIAVPEEPGVWQLESATGTVVTVVA